MVAFGKKKKKKKQYTHRLDLKNINPNNPKLQSSRLHFLRLHCPSVHPLNLPVLPIHKAYPRPSRHAICRHRNGLMPHFIHLRDTLKWLWRRATWGEGIQQRANSKVVFCCFWEVITIQREKVGVPDRPMGVSMAIVVPNIWWFTMENTVKMDDN